MTNLSEAQIEVGPDEPILRVIKSPHFVKDGQLKAAALRPARDTNKMSAVTWRRRPRPESILKAKCQSIGNTGANTYVGVAVISKSTYEICGTTIEPAEDEFPGHCHVVFPFVVPSDEPVEGENFRLQAEITHKLLAAAVFLQDPEPDSPDWTIRSELLP